MKKKLLTGIIAVLGLSLGMTSCDDDYSSVGSDKNIGMGHISPKVVIDGSIISASLEQASRANEDIAVTVTDLKLKLTSDDGSITHEWESINEFDESQDFKVGDYTLEAYYGNENDAEGYSKPHFYGSQELSVRYGHTTDVELSAELKNSRVLVRYTDAFIRYMTDYRVQIHTPKGKYINMPSDETSPAYVTPGLVNINLTFTKPNSTSATTIEAARFNAKPKTEHVVTIDIAGGDAGADAVLKILFDSTVDAENVDIDLSDDLIDAPAPEIVTDGWNSGESFPVIENSAAPSSMKANIIAPGKITSVYLNTDSPSLRAEGWPDRIDLVNASEPQIALLTSLGLNARGIWKNPDVMGVVDFTGIFPHLGVSSGLEESTHKFSIQVIDRYGKVSDEHEFSVVSGLGQVEILSATAEIGLKTINAEVEYNGSAQLSDVAFMMRNLYGTYDALTLTEAIPVSGRPGAYTVKLTSAESIKTTHTIRASFGSCYSDFDLVVTTPPFVLEVSPNDVFAHTAILTVKCDNADDAAVASNLSFVLNGREWDNFDVDGADIIISKLRAETTYTIEATTSNHTATAKITTEAEGHLPGCSHGDTDDHSVGFATTSWKGVNQGSNNNNCLQYLWTVEGWATMNELTISQHGTGIGSAAITGGASYKATSGTIPANGRSTQSFASGGLVGTTRHSDGHTTGNASLHKNKQFAGTNAALIRTVGWGSGNTAHSGTSENQGFGTCQHMTPGELYLGEYNNGAQYGVDFTSRPSSVTFYYHYDVVTPGNNDYGTAEVTVYDSEGEIVTQNSAKLTERSAYTPVTIPLTYKKGANKAAKLSIIFRSTDIELENNPALQHDTKYWHTPGGNNTSGGEYVGSELYIDDISLKY